MQAQLNPGVMMPMVGYGTAGLTDLTADAVFTAIRVGYRLVDSAGVGWLTAVNCTNMPMHQVLQMQADVE